MPDDRKLNAIPIPVRPLLFSADQDWIAFLPKPGVYQHGLYGELDFSPARLANILANFNANTYGQQLPINAEHDSAASGAVGWIADMRLAADGSLEVKPEWNERGMALLAGDRFRYVSAEFFDRWQDPVTGEWHDDVAVGLAICTRPHFKTDVLRPLAASEEAAMADAEKVPEPVRMTGEIEQEEPVPDKEPKPTPQPEPNPTPPTPSPEPTDDDATVAQMSERIMAEIAKEFGENAKMGDPTVQVFAERMARELAELRTRADEATRQARELSQRNESLQTENEIRFFTDEVLGQGRQNGTPWVGDIQDYVRMCRSLKRAFGEESWELQTYLRDNRSAAERDKANKMFTEYGTGRGGEVGSAAYDRVVALATERAEGSGKTLEQEFDAVLNSNAPLRAELARERRQERS